MSTPSLGCHVGPAGKQVLGTLETCSALELSAMQVFAGGRINRKISWPTLQQQASFRAGSAGIYKAVHAAYVLNPCAHPEDPLSRASIAYLIEALRWAEALEMDSVVVHPSSAKQHPPAQARAWAAQAMREIRSAYSGPVKLLLENTAGDQAGRLVGQRVEELEEIIEAAEGEDFLGVCFDTTHGFAAGYSLEEMAALPSAHPLIQLIHFNPPEPSVTQGGHKDRHGILSQSCWSPEESRELARALGGAGLPLILETRAPQDVLRVRGWLAE